MMRTPLYAEHVRLDAKMTEFAGWEMPLFYSGIIEEVSAVRTAAGIFDLSHMGELVVSGREALDLLQYLCTNDVSVLDVGDAQYSLMCDESGGIIDDLIIYRLEPEFFMLVVNASNADGDFEWIERHNSYEAECRNRSDGIGLVAVQGPTSRELLQTLVSMDVDSLRRFSIKQGRVGEVEAWIARTGYTGEDGFELYCEARDCRQLWLSLMAAGRDHEVKLAGLGARNVLRTEAGYPLYGNELTRLVTPVNAGLLWTVKLEKGDFIGRQAVLDAKDRRPVEVLAGLMADDRCIPRDGYDVLGEGRRIGRITSGTFSPTIGKGIAMAYVETGYSGAGTALEVQVRGKSCACHVVSMPFYSRQKRSIGGKPAKGVSSDS